MGWMIRNSGAVGAAAKHRGGVFGVRGTGTPPAPACGLSFVPDATDLLRRISP